jgi:hypothetical protein
MPQETSLLRSVFFGLLLWIAASANAQQLTIGQRTHWVMNGSVHVVMNNTGIVNHGRVTAGNSTVHFRGTADTAVARVSGSQVTQLNNMTVRKLQAGVKLQSNVWLRNTLRLEGGVLFADSNLVLKSDSVRTARVAAVTPGATVVGKAIVERFIPARRAWRLVTAPVSQSNSIFQSWQNNGVYTLGKGTLVTGPNPSGAAGNGLDVSAMNNVSMRRWSASLQNFDNVTNTFASVSGGTGNSAANTGYFLFVRGDRNPINTTVPNVNMTTLEASGVLQTGAQTFTAASAAGAYTLIGNPYASPIDFDAVSKTNLMNRFYVWDPQLNQVGGYVMMDDLDGDGVFIRSVMPSQQSKELQSGQAFFVQTIAAGPASLTFQESNKIESDLGLTGFRPQQTLNNVSASQLMYINLYLPEANGTRTVGDGVLAEFNAQFSAAVDAFDGFKFGNVNENLAIMRDGKSLAAERRPEIAAADTIFLRVTRSTPRNYEFEFVPENLARPGMMAVLIDNFTATQLPLSLTGRTTYALAVTSATASTAANRFMIVFRTINAVLPVTITKLTAQARGAQNEVNWEVAQEINIEKYVIEKSNDGRAFVAAGEATVVGTNNAQNAYRWVDQQPFAGTTFYRLQIIERSGATRYTSIVKVSREKANAGVVVYPNPVRGQSIQIQLSGMPSGDYQVQIIGMNGQLIHTDRLPVRSASETQSIQLSQKLAAGVYQLVMLDAAGGRWTTPVIAE